MDLPISSLPIMHILNTWGMYLEHKAIASEIWCFMLHVVHSLCYVWLMVIYIGVKCYSISNALIQVWLANDTFSKIKNKPTHKSMLISSLTILTRVLPFSWRLLFKYEDIKGETRSRESKNDRQYNVWRDKQWSKIHAIQNWR